MIREAASLSEKKYRDALGFFLLEGPNIVSEALRLKKGVKCVFARAGSDDPETLGIVSLAEAGGIPVYEVGPELMRKIAGTRTPQSIAAEAELPAQTRESFAVGTAGGNVLVLDRLQDPGNVGTLIRTAEAMGFAGVIAVKGTADPWQPKAVRSAAGSVLRLPVITAGSAEEALDFLERLGKKVFTAAAEGRLALWDADLAENAAIVIGNEGAGASEAFRRAAELLSIPMAGQTESLNAAAAGAVIMYESMRQKGRK
ncbi:MAG: RNA methyltransferase [Firmicutes bacterium]|nr:RNA methyltransferase [Bacillota bacterium]